jgi:hypothetical protein
MAQPANERPPWPWTSPEATRRGLSQLIRNRYPPAERQLRVQEIAFRRLLARLFACHPGGWVVKGGVALVLRLDPNRTSDDIDIAYILEAGEHALAVERLREACAVNLDDFITFQVGRVVTDSTTDGDPTVSVRVTTRIGNTDWTSFNVDLARPALDIPGEPLEPRSALTGLSAVDAIPGLIALPLAPQIAQKTCAMFERHGPSRNHSTRARDLVDIAMISDQQAGIRLADILTELEKEQALRLERGTLDNPLPESLTVAPDQTADWQQRWPEATRNSPLTFDQALERAKTFLAPALAGSREQLAWEPISRTWRPDQP